MDIDRPLTQIRRRTIAELRRWARRALDETAEPGQQAAAAREVDRLRRELAALDGSDESQRPPAGETLWQANAGRGRDD